MKILLAALVAMTALAGSCALAATPPAAAPATAVNAENTAGVIVFEVNGTPEAILLISKTGQYAASSFHDCATNKECRALVEALEKAGKVEELSVKYSLPDSLPEGEHTTTFR